MCLNNVFCLKCCWSYAIPQSFGKLSHLTDENMTHNSTKIRTFVKTAQDVDTGQDNTGLKCGQLSRRRRSVSSLTWNVVIIFLSSCDGCLTVSSCGGEREEVQSNPTSLIQEKHQHFPVTSIFAAALREAEAPFNVAWPENNSKWNENKTGFAGLRVNLQQSTRQGAWHGKSHDWAIFTHKTAAAALTHTPHPKWAPPSTPKHTHTCPSASSPIQTVGGNCNSLFYNPKHTQEVPESMSEYPQSLQTASHQQPTHTPLANKDSFSCLQPG